MRQGCPSAAILEEIKCTTGGQSIIWHLCFCFLYIVQPITLCKVTKARKATTDVTPTTARRRAHELQALRQVTNGGDTGLQLARELRLVPRDELQDLLKSVSLDQIRIPDGHLLAAKVDLNMTYRQTRELKRWLKEYNITLESERTSRQITKSLLEEHGVWCQLLPFTARDGDGGHTVKLLPAAAVNSLRATVDAIVRRNAEEGKLTWHEGVIPAGELWIKILGDHGGGSFKMAFQVLNKESPNSRTNTVVFNIFNAKDSRENLATGMGRFSQEIDELQGRQCRLPDGRDVQLRIFAAADYALLSSWYGISGACGMYLIDFWSVLLISIKAT
ncbi:PREDICTED: uncharacterized protein LOC109464011 [Branchiostoma belcheri]|uniref:Uncharacterized protein LOC109464011 n=1 Tax=Branchiostoma belcheri TaxID=7741 RepID=A0A6P4XIW0_BRABE|nr:PREDICTED: uncharacterized protein LOC109464011 [Branchiostoma belcheri]